MKFTVCQSLDQGNTEKVLQSPSFPNQYPASTECSWVIAIPPGYHVGFEFERFQMEGSQNCENDYLQLFDYKSNDWKSLGKFCGRNNPNYVNSTSNKMKVLFKTNNKISGIGFRVIHNYPLSII